jgi:hypothetical protein
MAEASKAFDQLAPYLDRLPVSAVSAQTSCPDLTYQLYMLEYLAVAMCFWNIIACAGFQGAYWGLRVAIAYYC